MEMGCHQLAYQCDYAVEKDFLGDDVTFCGVFDGHGPRGHLVARKVRDALPLKLLSFLNSCQTKEVRSRATSCDVESKSDSGNADKDGSVEEKISSIWRDALLKSFKAMDKELKSHSTLDCFCSGSTAVTIVKQGSNLFMAYIGDSWAIMGYRDSNDALVATQLTVDLKPDLASMRKGVWLLGYLAKNSCLKPFNCFDQVKQLKRCLVNSCLKQLFYPKQLFLKQLKFVAY